MRNKAIDILLAIGIIYVVIGHSVQPRILILPAYTFQVAIFFFVSGYFFTPVEGWKEKAVWIKKKFRKLLIPYFIFNLFFLFLSLYLNHHKIYLASDINLYNFFFVPFLNGQQFYLFLAAWFVPQLFLVHIAAQTIFKKNTKYLLLFLIIISVLISSYLMEGYKNALSGWEITGARAVLGLSFYLFGYAFKLFEDKIKKYILSFESFVFLFVLYVSLESFFGGFKYSFLFWDFSNNALITYLGSLSAILFLYIVCNGAEKLLSEKSFIYKIGRNTFNIMSLHILVFFSINLVLYKFDIISKIDLNNVFFQYLPEKYWFIYVGLGVFLPVIAMEKIKRLVDHFATGRVSTPATKF